VAPKAPEGLVRVAAARIAKTAANPLRRHLYVYLDLYLYMYRRRTLASPKLHWGERGESIAVVSVGGRVSVRGKDLVRRGRTTWLVFSCIVSVDRYG
jgi:hypothetical protein